jgi:hypothetical protein
MNMVEIIDVLSFFQNAYKRTLDWESPGSQQTKSNLK